MKPKLPCCEINVSGQNKRWACEHCQCIFQKKKMMENHLAEIHNIITVSRKRKLSSSSDFYGAKKMNWNWSCEYCESGFGKKKDLDNHVKGSHTCQTCRQIVLKDDKNDYEEKHQREKEEEEKIKREIERKKKQFYDNFMEKFVIPKKLNEYQSDEELDFDYILRNHRKKIGNDELLFFMKFGMEIREYDKLFSDEEVIFLLENDAVTPEEAASYIYISYEHKTLIEYFLNNGYDIQPQWVTDHIHDDELIERIKEKHNFTFAEIHSQGLVWDNQSRKRFYMAVHKHFPDPDFKEEYPSPKDFACVETKYVDDYLHSRYFYDEESDKLWIIVGYPERKILHEQCKKMIADDDLFELIGEYHDAITEYIEANKIVSETFDEIKHIRDAQGSPRYYDDERKVGDEAYLYENLYKEYLPDRNYWANVVSRTYFVIAQKSDEIPTLEFLAMKTIAEEKLKIGRLPAALNRKFKKLIRD